MKSIFCFGRRLIFVENLDQKKVLFTTVNQWFDESIFYENTVKKLYYPSVNYKEFKKYKDNYFKVFKNYPNEITILTYDALGLIYYSWKKNGKVNSVSDFSFKKQIKGKLPFYITKNLKNSLAKIIEDINSKRRSYKTVLLSPAAASFDQFKNFEERGDEFKRLCNIYVRKYF